MSACNAFTEHVWKPGECKNCFKPKSLHCLTTASETPSLSCNNLKTNANHSNNLRGRSGAGNFRPPVAKKPTIAVKPTMMVTDGRTLSGEMEVLENCENKHVFIGWNKNGVLISRKPVNNNNNEENSGYSIAQRSCPPDQVVNNRIPNNNNNGLTDVLKEIVGLDSEPQLIGKAEDKDSFLGRINKCYQRSLERKLPPSCIMAGMKENAGKHVLLSSSSEVISNEGGLFCFPDCSYSSDDREDNESSENAQEERESWDESDEELLAMEIRMRGQPRFANFRANTLSPVRFCTEKKWNTVPLRKQSLQRICAVDYDDSYDEILNGYVNEALIPYGQDSMPSILSSDSTTPDSSMTEGSQTGSTKNTLFNGDLTPSTCKETKHIEPDYQSICQNEQIAQVKPAPFKPARGTAVKSLETHKAVLALRLEEKDGKIALQSEKTEFTTNATENLGKIVTINFVPKEEQAKPYRVVDLEPPGMCKPYTIVDVSAAMNNKNSEGPTELVKGKAVSSAIVSSPGPLSGQVIDQKKSSITRYQEVWTSSTSPRQKMPKVALISSSSGPMPPPRQSSHKSAPTSPTATNISKTIPVKSPNLSEIKFNSYNNAGMPPFPIIIHDEPTYAQSSKHKVVKVPIVINPNAYDNLAIYKSFLGPSGSHKKKETSENAVGHTYEEIGSSENRSVELAQAKGTSSITERKVLGSVAQKVQEFNNVQNKAHSLLQGSPHKAFGSNQNSPSRAQKSKPESPARRDEIQERQVSGVGRENASTVLSQIVASIQPPQVPPENSQAQSKASSVEELYSQPANSEDSREILTRPKSLFSPQGNSRTEVSKALDSNITKGPKESILTKQVTVPISKPGAAQSPGGGSLSPKSEPLPPFPPPRSTSSPYHASNILHKHFSNWGKPTSPVRATETESPLFHSDVRQRSQEAKPKRWISFKSFFRRRKTEEEEEKDKEKDKDKLIGLNGRVIHMLPPPPIQRHHLCSEQKILEPSEKLTEILTCKPELSQGDIKFEVGKPDAAATGIDVHSTPIKTPVKVCELKSDEKLVMSAHVSENEPASPESPNPPPPPPKKLNNNLPDEVTIEDMPPQVTEVQKSASSNQEPPGGGSMMLGKTISQEEKDTSSESADDSISSATYSNLALCQQFSWRDCCQSRANMIPLKQPRQVKGASDDAITFGGSAELETMSESQPTPPPLPKKTIIRANTDPASKDYSPKTNKKVTANNLSLANPLYDVEGLGDANWDASSVCSSISSDARIFDNESGDSLDRAVGRSAAKIRTSTVNSASSMTMNSSKERSSHSLDSLSGRHRFPQRSGKSIQKPQRQTLYKGIENKEEVVMKIRNLHTDSLQKLTAKCEDRFMQGQKNQLRFGLDNWSDFRLTSDRPCCEAGDAVYYTASYAKDLHNQYAIKICKSQAKESQQQYYHSLAVRQSLTLHFNIQQDCGHFLAEVPVRMLPWEDPSAPGLEEESGESLGDPNAPKKDTCGSRSTSSKLRSRVVVITREVPYQTVADYVQQSAPRHDKSPDIYERQVCLLLLQLCAGLDHLKPHHVTHCDLRLENLLLVRCRQGGCESDPTSSPSHLARLIVSNFSQAKQKSQVVDPEILRDQSRLAPEIITITQYKKCDEFQTGILIYEMLHLPNPFEENPELKEKEYTRVDLPAIPKRSIYSQGLQQLAGLLLHPNPSERILISDAKVYLQCLLWGPRDDLLHTFNSCANIAQRDAVLQNWLDLKRTLLMIKFAEKALDTECNVSLEDWLCCQYLAFASVESLGRIVKLLQLQ
ncbi:inactive tyrosine-protein kinase PEAK1 isoform X1 [Callorhinchus milii]|uniref:inactive tyrosine-protein kinase PEAK1 isoform X1 n=1 Tax=Callorhinchus milii TaxID=7868 RepID=UPI001C3FE90A|nr:inactive tyrosine-protein kinase PEAK1 isoform X1 [Callorhinchus milii]XP_042198881.1 inactive tyrosine-protein kinase PEAK1 isoform X1 [Callorhinchus milii]